MRKLGILGIGLLLLFTVPGCARRSELFLDSVGQAGLKASDYYVEPISDGESDTSEGAAGYGAVMKLGELDPMGRPTYAHIRVCDAQEPGSHGEERTERISVDPAGWHNEKKSGEWVNNRCHLVGYQFSGLNDEPRNLAIGTAYVNKGVLGKGMDEDNPDCMLYYEQRLDDWLEENPDKYLDYYVRPVYLSDADYEPAAFYLQWVGIDERGEAERIHIGGKSETVGDAASAVLLENTDG